MNLRRIALILPLLAVFAVACSSDKKSGTSISPPPGDATPTATIGNVTVGIDKDGQTVTVPKGGQLTVRLDSNHTTGFQWLVRPGVPSNLTLAGDPQYEAPGAGATPGAGTLVGAGGTDVFTFKATIAGTQKLSLVYVRSFEPNNPPAKTFTVTVTVQ